MHIGLQEHESGVFSETQQNPLSYAEQIPGNQLTSLQDQEFNSPGMLGSEANVKDRIASAKDLTYQGRNNMRFGASKKMKS